MLDRSRSLRNSTILPRQTGWGKVHGDSRNGRRDRADCHTWPIDKSDRLLAAALYLTLAGAVSAAVLSVRSFTPGRQGEFAVATAGPAVKDA
jgi:hypothetical protein